MPTPRPLTIKQELFVRHYLVSLNATQAAREAGYAGGYPTWNSVGSENLAHPRIRERIERALSQKAMPPEEIIARLTEQARSEHARFLEFDSENGRLVLNIEAFIEAGLGHLIKECECHGQTGEVSKIKFYDAQAALEKLGKYYKLFADKTEVAGTITHEHSGSITFEEARQLPLDELAGRLRSALGEVAETTRRW